METNEEKSIPHSRTFSVMETDSIFDTCTTMALENSPPIITKKWKGEVDLVEEGNYSHIPEDIKFLILNDSQGDLLNPSSSYDPLENGDSTSSPTLSGDDDFPSNVSLFKSKGFNHHSNELQDLPAFLSPQRESFEINKTATLTPQVSALHPSLHSLSSLSGFSTASGTTLKPSLASLEKAKKLFDNIDSSSTFKNLNHIGHSLKHSASSSETTSFIQEHVSHSETSTSTITNQSADISTLSFSSESSTSGSLTPTFHKKAFNPPFKVRTHSSFSQSKSSPTNPSYPSILSSTSSEQRLSPTLPTTTLSTDLAEFKSGTRLKSKSHGFRVPFKSSPTPTNSNLSSLPSSHIPLSNFHSDRSSPQPLSNPSPIPSNIPPMLRPKPLFDLTLPLHKRRTLKELGPPKPDSTISYYSPTACASFVFPNGFDVHQAHQQMLADGAHVDFEWTQNHYQWILFKLTNQYRVYHRYVPPYSPTSVLNQLKYRYTRESYNQFSILKRIIEGEHAFGSIPFILFISAIHLPYLTLSDGWYSIRALLDSCLTRMVNSGKASIGSKWICLPEIQHQPSLQLKLSGNKTKRVAFHEKLGLSKVPLLLNLCAVAFDGGLCSQLQIQILRLYPLKKMITLEDGSKQHMDFKQRQSYLNQDQSIVTYLKMKVGCLSSSRTALLTFWNAEPETVFGIKEGQCFILLNVNATGIYKNMLQISTSRHTRWLPTKRKPKNDLYSPRKYTSEFNTIFHLTSFPFELDLKGNMVHP
ncbi:hypothetical protein HMI54_007569 [Coelomomyces lativittatus]|nr:hypothetical protein HMI54_007569 [Coelomomyces lativittatus]